MRALGLVGMLAALLIVGLLVKKQLGAAAPAPGAAATPAAAATSNPRQTQEQFKQSLDAAMQAPRAMPDEAK
ncbi:MAG TPA: hypothetical protein VLJ19_17715 [Variovorax sp.]|nr:hypothetical protein [Variovorax sp.]